MENRHDAPDEVDTALAAWGLEIDSQSAAPASHDVIYLWPCNVPAWNIWLSVQTQWRVGMGGRDGLDYCAVATYMREVLRIRPTRRWGEIWRALQAMESAALRAWSEMRDEKSA